MEELKVTMTVDELIYTTPRGNVITDSIKVAIYFGRLHKNIIKSVRRLMKHGLESEFRGIVGDRICYQMTQKGFEAVTKTLPGVDALRQAAIDKFNGKNDISFAEYTERTQAVTDVAPTSIETAIVIRNTDTGRFVDARQLHAFINDGATPFSMWFKRRVEQFGFIINEDFVAIDSNTSVNNDSIPGIGRPGIEYALTIDAAKELCMVEGNEKGRAVRRYFIEAEKRFRASQPTAPAIPQTFAQALRLAAEQAETIDAQQKQIQEQSKQLADQEADIKFVRALQTANTSIYVGDLAKLIAQNGVEIGGIRLFKWMRGNGYLTLDNKPTQKALEMGLFEIKTTQWEKPNGEINTSFTTLVTVKGQKYFINKFIYNTQHKP